MCLIHSKHGYYRSKKISKKEKDDCQEKSKTEEDPKLEGGEEWAKARKRVTR